MLDPNLAQYTYEGSFGGLSLTEEGARLVRQYGGCGNCPFSYECENEEIFYSCPVWEEHMGDEV